MSEVTRILSAIEQGDPHAAEQLLPLVYDELRKLAAAKLAQEKPGQDDRAERVLDNLGTSWGYGAPYLGHRDLRVFIRSREAGGLAVAGRPPSQVGGMKRRFDLSMPPPTQAAWVRFRSLVYEEIGPMGPIWKPGMLRSR
jgi:hypothetical protein